MDSNPSWQPAARDSKALIASFLSAAPAPSSAASSDSGRGSLFASGLVSTTLNYAYEAPDADTSGTKRPRDASDVVGIDDDRGDAPPPIRGGRGRVREENPPPRGGANTSRPASKHVDAVAGGSGFGVKRFANSSRAPSKHVDDYQSAPVVRARRGAREAWTHLGSPWQSEQGLELRARRAASGVGLAWHGTAGSSGGVGGSPG